MEAVVYSILSIKMTANFSVGDKVGLLDMVQIFSPCFIIKMAESV